MRSFSSVWLALSFALAFPSVALALDSGFRPPLAVFYGTDFPAATTPSIPNEWQIDIGSWMAANGTYDSTVAAPTAMSTIFEYNRNPNDAPDTDISPPYYYRARILNQGSDAASLAGVVYGVSDSNYFEVVFSPTGTATMRRALNGTISNVVSTSYSGGGRGVWFDVEVRQENGVTSIMVNGVEILHVPQSVSFGRVGLVTHGTTARFDKVALAFPFNDQPWTENFNSGLTQQWGTTGVWSVSGGTFNATSVQATSTAQPSVGGVSTQAEATHQFTFRARMLNPYGGAGNLVGVRFLAGGETQFGTRGSGEVVFSPTGVAKINLIYDGKTHTIATSPYNGRRNVWFDTRVDVTVGHVTVAVDGVELFSDVDAFPLIEGGVGLVTHWAPGKFDDVSFDNSGTFHPLSQTFSGALPTGWAISGTWDTNGGTLNDTSAKANDIVATNCGCWNTDIDYHARLLNQYGASGNLVGVVYNYQRSGGSFSEENPYQGLYAGDYYEVVFAPTGQAFMNTVLNGVRYRVASGTHTIPRNTWFDVDVLRQGTTTTVKVNGTTIFDKVPQVQPSKGDVGVIAHWAKANFDNLTIVDRPAR
jgi:hypothetical protein